LLSQVQRAYDDPIADSSILPTYLLSGFTREHVTVALSGDSGDELFAGYDTFAALGPASLARRVLRGPLHKGAMAAAMAFPVGEQNLSAGFKAQRFLQGVAHPAAMWNPVWMAPMPRALAGRFFTDPMPPEAVYADAAALWDRTPGGVVERSLAYYTRFYLGDQLLTKVDRAAMAHGLESRAVFLDNDLVDFARRLPTRFKMRGRVRKYILKRAVAPRLPSAIPGRAKKGFGSPITGWLKRLPPPEGDAGATGFDPSFMGRVWEAHAAGRADHRLLLWAWMCLHATLSRQAEVVRARKPMERAVRVDREAESPANPT
jgi:asparagine synthase (glutamine-hydrolysing)